MRGVLVCVLFLLVVAPSALADDGSGGRSLQVTIGQGSGSGTESESSQDGGAGSAAPVAVGATCLPSLMEIVVCFSNFCGPPGGYGESPIGPTPGDVGVSVGLPNTDGDYGPYVGAGVSLDGGCKGPFGSFLS